MRAFLFGSILVGAVAAACSSTPDAEVPAPLVRHRGDVVAVTSTDQALPGVVIPPFLDCRAPKDGKPGQGEGGKVCTHVGIAAATEPGRYFPDYASCAVVRTQRPYWAKEPASTPKKDDPRLADEKFVAELAWVTEQVRATACTCCHDKKQAPDGASSWDIALEPIWTDSISDRGLALFTGAMDSTILGAYPAADNHGFERVTTGMPSTDGARMKAFFVAEAKRRGLSDEKLKSFEPFGASLYDNWKKTPLPCANGEGVDASGLLRWSGPRARYVYVLKPGSLNPATFPNLDTPAGTLFRLDVLASAPPLDRGFAYGTTPEGSFLAVPETGSAPKLERGQTYQLWVGQDVALPITNCLFTYQGP